MASGVFGKAENSSAGVDYFLRLSGYQIRLVMDPTRLENISKRSSVIARHQDGPDTAVLLYPDFICIILSVQSPFASCIIMCIFALLFAVGHRAPSAFVPTPVPAHRAQQSRWLSWGRCSGGEICRNIGW